jgi:hypothetical protein
MSKQEIIGIKPALGNNEINLVIGSLMKQRD